MGTDAHFMVEVKSDDRWVAVIAPIWPDAVTREHGVPFGLYPVVPRHYGLYSLLADVRNRTGRGKVSMIKQHIEGHGEVEFRYDTDDGGHEPLRPIAPPRGLPEDVNGPWRKFTQESWVHDPTWLTLDELESADWDQVLQEQAIVREEDYLLWRETGEMPELRPRGVGGEGIRVVTVEQYEAGERGETTAIDFHWVGQTLREDVPKAWWATLAVMRMIAPHGDTEKVRLLVAFDS